MISTQMLEPVENVFRYGEGFLFLGPEGPAGSALLQHTRNSLSTISRGIADKLLPGYESFKFHHYNFPGKR